MALILATSPSDILLDSSDEDEGMTPRIQRMLIRKQSNVLAIENTRFTQLFRLDKEAFLFILNEYTTTRINLGLKISKCIDPSIKLAAALRFFAQGSYQLSVGQDFFVGMAQSTLSTVLNEMIEFMETHLCPRFIKFSMSETENTSSKQRFYEKTGFPGIIGCVDGTHIKLIRPSKEEHLFYNRKGYHSLNAMIVCDYNRRIMAVDARFGGASHDSFVWSLSKIRGILQHKNESNNELCQGWMLGDAGYPLEPWIMTPYRNAVTNSDEAVYNTKHAKARVIIENTIGILKARFRCLLGARELHYTPEKACRIVNVCCALHNICVDRNINFDESTLTYETDASDHVVFLNNNVCVPSRAASQIRNNIKQNL